MDMGYYVSNLAEQRFITVWYFTEHLDIFRIGHISVVFYLENAYYLGRVSLSAKVLQLPYNLVIGLYL